MIHTIASRCCVLMLAIAIAGCASGYKDSRDSVMAELNAAAQDTALGCYQHVEKARKLLQQALHYYEDLAINIAFGRVQCLRKDGLYALAEQEERKAIELERKYREEDEPRASSSRPAEATSSGQTALPAIAVPPLSPLPPPGQTGATNPSTRPSPAPLADVVRCTQFIPKPQNSDFASVKNNCSVTVWVEFCYFPAGRTTISDAFDCGKGQFGGIGPLKPGKTELVSYVPGRIMLFPCQYPEGKLNLGAGVGNKTPVTQSSKYTCDR